MQYCNGCLRDKWILLINQDTTQKEEVQKKDDEQTKDESYGTERHSNIYDFIATLLEGYCIVRDRSHTKQKPAKSKTTNRKNITKNALFEDFRRRLNA